MLVIEFDLTEGTCRFHVRFMPFDRRHFSRIHQLQIVRGAAINLLLELSGEKLEQVALDF
ncbi:hypothetical protein D3C77_812590 [compost metagenome]